MKYDYDGYGNPTITYDSNNIASINNILYKGYYYDKESGLYYLINRYYNPRIRRFMSLDSIEYLNYDRSRCFNLYAYCNNNPVMYSDPEGEFVASIAIGALIGLACTGLKDLLNDGKLFNGDVSGWEYLGSAIGGAIGGLGTGIGTTMLFGGVGNVVSDTFSGQVKSFDDGFVQFVIGALTSGAAYGISKAITTKLASNKISSIIGFSSKNSKINASLAKHGFDKMKVGKMGMKAISNELYKKLGYKNAQDVIGDILSSGLGFIF